MKDLESRKKLIQTAIDLLTAFYFYNDVEKETALISHYQTNVKDRGHKKNLWYAEQIGMHIIRRNVEYISRWFPDIRENIEASLQGYNLTTFVDCMDEVNQCSERWEGLYDPNYRCS